MKREYYGTVNGGVMKLHNRQQFNADLCELDGQVCVTVAQVKDKRTNMQNALYWVYIKILGDALGYYKDEVHEIVKFKFLKKQVVNEDSGEILEYIGSTTGLSRAEFGELIDRMVQWAAEMKIELPAPGEQLRL